MFLHSRRCLRSLRTGNDKTLLYFTAHHRLPDALVDALSVLKQHEINLTEIDSWPSGAMNSFVAVFTSLSLWKFD
ncbi:hypothetical protein BJ741DRAFT_570584 [Chytriomyces cf. hyalinus JEL632]|nr:hypothetical protein BJ741DRAFT_570584 [Chytriomyces cf. hyalinus JEL632]